MGNRPDTTRRTAIAGLLLGIGVLALPAGAGARAADEAEIARIQAYLNEVKSFEARFTQVAPDGSISQGRVLMRRPGRMRFEYDPPVPILLVADGNFFIFHDKELRQTSHIPLGSTPLAFLVREKIEFGESAGISALTRGPGTLRLTVFDPKKPKEGSITLVFSEEPLALRQWVVEDAGGQQTEVTLSDVRTNIPLKSDLFYFVDMGPR
ncbi:MAG: outer membrane lipoprotein carrier protein LolA [Alphaproteobacteria bacterium]|nr:outer membrane lipoprotein carrier protein LolA [Alphaproteobacteria bacterium]